jgi:hypothetical protein
LSGVLIRREQDTVTHRGKDHEKTQKKVTFYKPRREASEETNTADTLIINFQPPEL